MSTNNIKFIVCIGIFTLTLILHDYYHLNKINKCKIKNFVKSKKIFTAEEYYYYISNEKVKFNNNDEYNQLRDKMDNEDFNMYWDYPLDEVDEIIENELDVVLVRLSWLDENNNNVITYRWFEVD